MKFSELSTIPVDNFVDERRNFCIEAIRSSTANALAKKRAIHKLLNFQCVKYPVRFARLQQPTFGPEQVDVLVVLCINPVKRASCTVRQFA